MEQEIWKDVAGYDGKYSISNFGRVRSNFSISKLGKKRPLGTILKTSINRRGYETVGLFGSNGKKSLKVHRLVCAAFHPNPENKPQVNHKDLNQLNNFWWNLEWVTAKENVLHAQENGRIPIAKPYVKKGRFSKMVVNTETGETISAKKLSQTLNISYHYLTKILRGDRPNDTPYRYVGEEYKSKNRIRGVEQPKPTALFDVNWNLIGEFNYLSDFKHIVDVSGDTLRDFVTGKIGQYKGYKFKQIDANGNYVEPILFVPKERIYKGGVKGRKISEEAKMKRRLLWEEKKKNGYEYRKGKEVIQKDLNGVEIGRFISIGAVVRHFGAKDKSVLRKVLSGKNGKTYKGYKWEYA